jgi:D-alanyl-D-alanine carboxypeptidase (penicillin-binding protein 5/6)
MRAVLPWVCAAVAGMIGFSVALAPPVSADPPTAVGGPQLASHAIVANSAPGVPALPAVPASGWLVADLDTGEVLAAGDAHGEYAPASTLKVLTALIVIPRLDPAKIITATSEEVAVDGTKVGVVPNHAYTVDMLLQGMLAVSGNDTARVLAGALGGDAAVETLMNAKAQELQAYDTHASSVTGLDAVGQHTSAYDLALIGRAGLDLPSFRKYVATTRSTFLGQGVPPFAIQNHNPLLGNYPGTYGVKNGYTDAARASYIGAAVRNGHHLIVTMIHANPDFRLPADALLDWGFAADGKVQPIGTLVGAADTETAAKVGSGSAPVVADAGNRAVSASPSTVAPRHSGLSSAEYGALGIAAGLLLLIGGRRAQIRRRRRTRALRSGRRLRLPPI